jgi:hypothetical protein
MISSEVDVIINKSDIDIYTIIRTICIKYLISIM